MKGMRIGGIALLLGAAAAPLSAQTPPSIKAQLIARMQVQYNTTSVAEEELIAAGRTSTGFAASTFELRRVRFGAEVTFNDWISGKLESELAMARLAMREMYINLGFTPAFQLRLGQFKRPFGLIELTSESILPVIERGVRIRGLQEALLHNAVAGEEFEILTQFGHISYDLGAAIRGRIGQFAYDIGAFNGEGSDRSDTNDNKSFAGRITYTVKMDLPVIIGTAASYRETRTAAKPELENATSTAYSADLEIGAFRRSGLHFLGEVALGDNLAVDDEFFGAHGIVGFFKPIANKRVEGIEIAGRLSYGDPRKDVDGDEGMLFTPGFNVYFSGRNRLMINWDVYKASGDRLSGENALRMQAQLYY
jgi:hypothetical protein